VLIAQHTHIKNDRQLITISYKTIQRMTENQVYNSADSSTNPHKEWQRINYNILQNDTKNDRELIKKVISLNHTLRHGITK